jgi:hypothetical protein
MKSHSSIVPKAITALIVLVIVLTIAVATQPSFDDKGATTIDPHPPEQRTTIDSGFRNIVIAIVIGGVLTLFKPNNNSTGDVLDK